MKDLILIAVMSISFSGAAFAAEAPKVKIGYSADSSMEMEAGAMNVHVYSMPGKERREMDQRAPSCARTRR